MMVPAVEFAEFFRRATGQEPYVYQRTLGEATHPPSVLKIPTGAGKTQAVIASWLYARRVHGRGPRRLVYALPMRTLVEQTVDVAMQLRSRMKLSESELPICTLMGGSEIAELKTWQKSPEHDQILIGTVDMLLSRALNRGYAESRFAWPIAFGLLNNDCRWVFDEVQLMGPARATSAQLDGLRRALGAVVPCETVWMSATIDTTALQTVDRPQVGEVMLLPDEDRRGALRDRLDAPKTLERIDAAGHSSVDLAALVADVTVERHIPGSMTLVIVNTVDLAQAAYRSISSATDTPTVLLHSRFRPEERAKHTREALRTPESSGMILVATQVVEAGVDISARTLVTETAPFSSIVQRLGRCNRTGEYGDSKVVWLDRGPVPEGSTSRKAATPYTPDEIERAREALLGLQGASLSPQALEQIEVDDPPDDPTVLRRQDLLDLFDTSPDISGTDVDIAPFIREDDHRSIAVLFRDLSADAPSGTSDERGPDRAELVTVPLGSLGKRPCWMIDHLEGEWVRRATRELPPGATVMLRSADGGYDAEVGWDGSGRRSVEPVSVVQAESTEGIGSDRLTEAGQPEELLSHLEKVADTAAQIAAALGLEPWRDALRCAGALHDIGKAHPAFQEALLALMPEGGSENGRLWAKSGRKGALHCERPYFRHELASALASRQLDGVLLAAQRDLITYLIAAHHGKVRLSIRPAPDETRPGDADGKARFAMGVVEGDVLPEVETPIGPIPPGVLDLSPMELGAEDSWTDTALRLRDDPQLGPFRLAFFEALLRVADWRASSA